MEASDIAVVGSVLLQLLTLVASGIWFATAMKINTAELLKTIEHLTLAITELKETIRKMEAQQQDHEVRVSLLEDRKTTH